MALQVWLPLNGDLTNQGLSNVTVTNNGATVDNNGKIGKCYSFNGSSNYITISSFSVPENFSISIWGKWNSLNNWSRLVDFGSATSGTGYGFLIANSTTSSNMIFSYECGSGSVNVNIGTIVLNTWYHIVITFQGTNIKIYLNGILVKTVTSAASVGGHTLNYNYLGKSNWSQDALLNGKLNDFRIYDHTLSAKEVKDLAKGLVLHYRLAGPGVLNQARNTSRAYTNPYSSFNGGINTCINLSRVDTSGLKVGDIIHVHLEYKYNNIVPSSGQTALCWIQGAGNVTNWNSGTFAGSPFITLSGSGIYIFDYDITITADHLKNEYWPTSIRHDYIQTGSVQWKDFKVEKCSIATPWCPNPSDALYSAMGYNNNIEYDCSGYRRNGTKSGTITWDIDSPRYTTSYKFGSTSTKIKATEFGMSGFMNSYSFSWWQKNTSSANMPWGFSNGNRLNLYHTNSLCWNTGDGSSNPFKDSSGVAIPNTKLCDSKWHHCVVTGNGTSVLLYIDGKLIGTATSYKGLTGTQIYLSGWDSSTNYTFNGSNLSDFRIYATALSAEDVAELYHSAVIVDNTGKSYAYEYFEAQ